MIDKTQDPALLPCPFCGIAPYSHEVDPGAPVHKYYWWIECETDDCPMKNNEQVGFRQAYRPNEPHYTSKKTALDEARAEATERWNRRPSPASPAPSFAPRIRVSVGDHHAEVQIDRHAPAEYNKRMVEEAFAEALRRASPVPQTADPADIARIDREAENWGLRLDSGAAWRRVRALVDGSQKAAPASGADTREAENKLFCDWFARVPYEGSPATAAKKGWMARAALAPVASPPAPAATTFGEIPKPREATKAYIPQAAAPLAPDPLPAGLGSPLDVLGAAIERDIWMQLNGDTITDRYVALKGVVHEILGRAPTPPESGAPAPNLMREADKRASLIRLLWDAHRDIGEWMRLANAIRDEGVLPTNHGRCPTARAILASAAIRGHIAAEIASQDEAQAESVSVANGPIPSQIEPGEKDQDGSAKGLTGAGAPSEGK